MKEIHFLNSQWIENFAELTFDSEPVTISLLTDWQVNDYEAQVERKPQILLQSGPKSWWNKNFYDTFIAEYSNISKRNDRGITEIDTNKFDLYTRRVPPKLGKGFTYTPPQLTAGKLFRLATMEIRPVGLSK